MGSGRSFTSLLLSKKGSGSNWVMRTVHFHDETLEIQRSYAVTESKTVWREHDTASCSNSIDDSPGGGSFESSKQESSPLTSQQPESQALPGLAQLQEVNILPAKTTQRHQEALYSTHIPQVDTSAISSQGILLNEREAILMRNFIDNMALWV